VIGLLYSDAIATMPLPVFVIVALHLILTSGWDFPKDESIARRHRAQDSRLHSLEKVLISDHPRVQQRRFLRRHRESLQGGGSRKDRRKSKGPSGSELGSKEPKIVSQIIKNSEKATVVHFIITFYRNGFTVTNKLNPKPYPRLRVYAENQRFLDDIKQGYIPEELALHIKHPIDVEIVNKRSERCPTPPPTPSPSMEAGLSPSSKNKVAGREDALRSSKFSLPNTTEVLVDSEGPDVEEDDDSEALKWNRKGLYDDNDDGDSVIVMTPEEIKKHLTAHEEERNARRRKDGEIKQQQQGGERDSDPLEFLRTRRVGRQPKEGKMTAVLETGLRDLTLEEHHKPPKQQRQQQHRQQPSPTTGAATKERMESSSSSSRGGKTSPMLDLRPADGKSYVPNIHILLPNNSISSIFLPADLPCTAIFAYLNSIIPDFNTFYTLYKNGDMAEFNPSRNEKISSLPLGTEFIAIERELVLEDGSLNPRMDVMFEKTTSSCDDGGAAPDDTEEQWKDTLEQHNIKSEKEPHLLSFDEPPGSRRRRGRGGIFDEDDEIRVARLPKSGKGDPHDEQVEHKDVQHEKDGVFVYDPNSKLRRRLVMRDNKDGSVHELQTRPLPARWYEYHDGREESSRKEMVDAILSTRPLPHTRYNDEIDNRRRKERTYSRKVARTLEKMGCEYQCHEDTYSEDGHPRLSSTDDDDTMDEEYVERKMRHLHGSGRANDDGRQHPKRQDDVFDDISEELRQISEEGYERQSHDDDSDFVRKTDFFSRHRGIYDDDNGDDDDDDDDDDDGVQ